ncbi:MAG: glycosyltransferase [Lachnospiraceae bacterium]|nr:glycosyltransferase [Lachnospiraceae bacterium]
MSKILFHLNTLSQGGAERVVSNLANEFVKGLPGASSKTPDEILVATEWFGEDEFPLDERVRRIHAGLKKSDEKRSRFSKAVRRFRYLRELVKKENPDVVVAFCDKAIYRTLIATTGLKTPIIICVRTDPVGHYDRPMDRILGPFFYPRAKGAVFQTEGQRDFFPDYLGRISTIILNPVNDRYFLTDDLKERQKNQTDTIVQHARLVDFKNQPMLIDAFMKVHEKHPEFDLKIYGPDSEDGTKEILERKIAEYHAESFIHLMGGSDEIEKEVPKAKIYAFSSDWEGLPNALLEAMAMGMPIVATDCPCGGPRTVMKDHESGILVPIKDPDAMAKGLLTLIEDPELALRMAEGARKIRELTNSATVVSLWREYIESVIRKAKK